MRKLQKLNKSQMVKLLDAINREEVDNQFWAINSYENSWNAAEVFSGTWTYNIVRENAEEPPVSYHFYSKTRIMAFIQHENETLEVAWEMQEIAQQKPILCLESHTVLFRGALDAILEAYSKDEYSEEELQKEYSQDNSEITIDWMRYKFGCSDKYEADYCCGYSALETNVGYAIDAAWTWFRTGYVNNFISINPATRRIHLSW